jgi:hypothetical protein
MGALVGIWCGGRVPLVFDMLRIFAIFVGFTIAVFVIGFVIVRLNETMCVVGKVYNNWQCLNNCSTMNQTSVCQTGELGFDIGVIRMYVFLITGSVSFILAAVFLSKLLWSSRRGSTLLKLVASLLATGLIFSMVCLISGGIGFAITHELFALDTKTCRFLSFLTEFSSIGILGWSFAILLNLIFMTWNPALYGRHSQNWPLFMGFNFLVWVPTFGYGGYLWVELTEQNTAEGCLDVSPFKRNGIWAVLSFLTFALFSIFLCAKRLNIGLFRICDITSTQIIMHAIVFSSAFISTWSWSLIHSGHLSTGVSLYILAYERLTADIMIGLVGFVNVLVWAVLLRNRGQQGIRRATFVSDDSSVQFPQLQPSSLASMLTSDDGLLPYPTESGRYSSREKSWISVDSGCSVLHTLDENG